MKIIYLDNAATTRVAPEVEAAMAPLWGVQYGNASSRFHAFGWEAEEIVSQARNKIADHIGAKSTEIVFTSGASEALQLLFMGWVEAGGKHVVVPVTEHSVVLDLATWALGLGKKVTFWPVDEHGNLKEDFQIQGEPDLVLLMYGNNEIGTLHPVSRWAKKMKQLNPHCWVASDATQALGKILVDFQGSGLDFLVGSAHKLHGPKGIGLLCVRQNISFFPWGKSHRQERGRRAGTLAVPLIEGFRAAMDLPSNIEKLQELRDRLEYGIIEKISGTWVNGNRILRLPHISSITFSGIDGERLFQQLTRIAVSNGSACTSAEVIPSHVLKAIGLSSENAESTVRFSLSKYTTEEEVDLALNHVLEVVGRLRKK